MRLSLMMKSIKWFSHQLARPASSQELRHWGLRLRRQLREHPDHRCQRYCLCCSKTHRFDFEVFTLRKSSISVFSTSAFSRLCFSNTFLFSWFGEGIATPFFIGFEGKKSFIFFMILSALINSFVPRMKCSDLCFES